MSTKETSHAGTPARSGSVAAPLAATVVVIACTAFLRWQGTAAAPRPEEFAPAEDAQRRPYVALVVAQPSDCDTGTRYLGALNAPEVRAAAHVGALLIGGASEMARASELLRDRFGDLPVRRATRRNLVTLRALGLRATPAVVLLDHSGSVLLGAPAPVNADGAERLRRVLMTLLSQDSRLAEESHAASG